MYTVLTPAGKIFVETSTEAREYRCFYGYPYYKDTAPEEDESIEEELTNIEQYENTNKKTV